MARSSANCSSSILTNLSLLHGWLSSTVYLSLLLLSVIIYLGVQLPAAESLSVCINTCAAADISSRFMSRRI